MGRPTGSKDKIRRKFVNSFARQYLEDHKIQVFSGNDQVLTPIGQKLYRIKLPNTRYHIGEQFIEQGETQKITKFEELRDLGFVIISVRISSRQRWATGQKVVYELRRVNESGDHLNKVPTDHYVEYDGYNKAGRLVGPRAGPMNVGRWVPVSDKREAPRGAGRKVSIKNLSKSADKILHKQMLRWSGQEEAPKPVHIPEVAFMITNSNEIVCFPNIPDMPSIMISGMKGSGKCIVQDDETDFILDSEGRWVKIADKPKEVLVLNNNLKFEKAKVKGYFDRFVDEVIEIETAHHRKLLLTPEHPVLTVKGWKQIKDIKKGEFIGVSGKYRFTNTKYLRKSTVTLLAYLIAAGTLDAAQIRFKGLQVDYDTKIDIIDCLKDFNPDLVLRRNKVVNKSRTRKNTLKNYLSKLGLLGLSHKEKFIPNAIMQLCDKQIALFLSKYFSANGHIVNRKVIFSAESPIVARQILHLLLRFGIISYLEEFKPNDKTPTRKRRNGSFIIIIANSEGILKFQDLVRLYPKYKHQRLLSRCSQLQLVNRCHGNHDLIPGDIWSIAQPKDWFPAYQELGYTYKKSQLKSMNFNITRNNLKKIVRGTKNKKLAKYANSDVLWDKIKKKRLIKKRYKVWDIEVDHPSHNFVANDIIVHNSFCLHSLVSRFFWKPEFNYKICILNDSSRETGTWTLPNQDINQINILKRLNEKPLPLPCVFLHPLVKEDYEKLFIGDVGFDVTIPFNDIVEHHKQYLNLKESGRYFTKIKEELVDCRTQAQAERIFDDMILHYKIPSQSANKIRAEFDTLFDSKMTDISTSGQLPWSTSKNPDIKYNPFTACVHAGVLPVLETEFVSNYKQLLSIYFSYFVGDLFNRQKQDIDFLKEKSELFLVIDEAHNISQKSFRSGADMLLRRCVREGRPRRIGTLIATQKFNELPNVIAENTMFLICFKSPGEAPEIVRQYNLGKHMVNTIRDLGKHECIAYTTEHFIIYDSNGKRRKSKLNEVFIGKTLPPYSMHKKPKASGGLKK